MPENLYGVAVPTTLEAFSSDRPIGVLCGGPSAEREISLKSGQAVYEALLAQGLPTVLVVLSEKPTRIPGEIQAANLGVAFIVLHGPFGEDGTIQMILEKQHIPYTGSAVEACRYSMDKIHARRRWRAQGLPTPDWKEVGPINAEAVAKKMRFPLIIKPAAQGSSIGMSIADAMEDLPKAIEKAAQFGEGILLEEYLEGLELTVGILGDKPLPVIQIVPKNRFYDFEAKYTPGMTEYRVPAPLPSKSTRICQEMARFAHEALGCHIFSRVDMILSQSRGPVLLEINPIPGMTETSLLPKAAAAVGIGFPELVRRMLNSAFERRGSFRGERWVK